MRFLFGQVITRLPPFHQYRRTPERAGRVLASILTAEPGTTGTYYDEKGEPMTGSASAHDPGFQDRVVAEARAFLLRN